VSRRPRVVLALVAAIAGLCVLTVPLSAGAAIARPTNLRPVQSKADCAAALSLMAVICGTAVTEGKLQLIWDESDKGATGYKVYELGAGGQKLLGTSTARYYLVNRPSEGYANLCFAVAASVGSRASAESSRYCYAPGATAVTRSFKPTHTITQVAWTTPSGVACNGLTVNAPEPGSFFFQGADKDFGSAFTAFFPWLTNESSTSGRVGIGGVYVGNEAAVMQVNVQSGAFTIVNCTVVQGQRITAQIHALGGAAFNLGSLVHHKLYSASLTLTVSQTVNVASNRATVSNGGWCPIFIGAANREWWLSPLGNLTYNNAARINVVSQPAAPIDVTSLVSAWASVRYANNFGFIVSSTLPTGAVPIVSNACLTKFSTPSLQVVSF